MSDLNKDLDYAKDDAEAERRFKQYKSRDPFPEIPPALLNSADIADYVAATGMVCPFHPEGLKSASYEVAFLDTFIEFGTLGTARDGDSPSEPLGRRHQKTFVHVERGTEITLRRNSIAFVSIEPVFRLPDYIAVRFNLKITHVHRGVLLGTGPLVDPGYRGKLLIPLHNLTNNDYTLTGGEGLIWVEFTKLSTDVKWSDPSGSTPMTRRGRYEPFPDRKIDQPPVRMLQKALEDQGATTVVSSMSEVIRSAGTAERAVDDTQQRIDRLERRFRNIGLVGGSVTLFGLFLTLLALFYQVFSVVSDAQSFVDAARDRLEARIAERDSLLARFRRDELGARSATVHGAGGHMEACTAEQDTACVGLRREELGARSADTEASEQPDRRAQQATPDSATRPKGSPPSR